MALELPPRPTAADADAVREKEHLGLLGAKMMVHRRWRSAMLMTLRDAPPETPTREILTALIDLLIEEMA